MLSSYFKRNTTLATFCNGPAGPYLDEFTDWLSKRGFQQETIRRRILGAVQFVDWTQATRSLSENNVKKPPVGSIFFNNIRSF